MSCRCRALKNHYRSTFLSWLGTPLEGGSPGNFPSPDPAYGVTDDEFYWADKIAQPAPGQWVAIHTNEREHLYADPAMNGPQGDWDGEDPTYTRVNFARGRFTQDEWIVEESYTAASDEIRFEATGVASCRSMRVIDETRLLCIFTVRRAYRPWWTTGSSRYTLSHMGYAVVFDLTSRTFGPKTLVAGSTSYNPSEGTRFDGVSIQAPVLSRLNDTDWHLLIQEEGVSVLRSNATFERDDFESQPKSRIRTLRVAGNVVSVVSEVVAQGVDWDEGVSSDVVFASAFETTQAAPGGGGTVIVLIFGTWGNPIPRGQDLPTVDGHYVTSMRPYMRVNRSGYSDRKRESYMAMINLQTGVYAGNYPTPGNFVRPVITSRQVISARMVQLTNSQGAYVGSAVESYHRAMGMVERRVDQYLLKGFREVHQPVNEAGTVFINRADLVSTHGKAFIVARSPEAPVSGGQTLSTNEQITIRQAQVFPGLARFEETPYEIYRSETTNQMSGHVDVWGPWLTEEGAEVVVVLHIRRDSSQAYRYGVYMVRVLDREHEIQGNQVQQRLYFDRTA